jgi:SAM-dependent methyltransferase
MISTDGLRRVKRRWLGTAAARSPLVRRASFRLRWSSTRRLEPLSEWGFERGTPVDRLYIERFLEEHRDLVHGRVLEVKEDLYASALGASVVDVLDIDPSNAEATVVGDLCDSATLPADRFDAAIVTQTLLYMSDPVVAVENLLRSLRAGASALVTVPALTRIAGAGDRWRFTPHGLREVVERAGGEALDVRSHGNVVTCRAFLLGAAAEELPTAVLDHDDPDFPLVVTAVVRKRPVSGLPAEG